MSARREPNRISLCTEDDDIVLISLKSKLCIQGFEKLNELRRNGQLCDVILRVSGKKLSAHKLVLAASIPYFHVMFTSDMIEAAQKEITIYDLDWETLEQLIEYAYTGDIKISAGNVQAVMIGANFLQMDDVVEECSLFLLARVDSNNVIAQRSFCRALGCRQIASVSMKFIQKHFLAVSKSEDFLQLNVWDVTEILNDDHLYVESEEDIFTAAMRWVLYECDRQRHLPTLLSCVRMHLLKPSFLSDEVASHRMVRGDIACRDLVDEAKDYHLIPERRSQCTAFKLRPRTCMHVPGLIFAIGGLSQGGKFSAVEMFDPLTRRWTPVQAMSSFRSRVGVATHERKIYAIGGFDGLNRLCEVEVYDYNIDEWIQCAPLKKKRSALGAVFFNDKLYVCGGYDGITSLATVEVYCPHKDIWTPAPSMSKQRSAAGVAVLGEYLYVIGGHDGMSIFNSVERYSPEKNTWEAVPSMITKRCRLGATALNGKIYACGGYDGSQFLNSVECFDPEEMKWTPVTPMKIKRSRVSLVSNQTFLYAIAGYDGTTNLSSMEIYNEDTDDWNLAPSMSTHEGGVGVGVILVPPYKLSQTMSPSTLNLFS